jgi:hypothetical protein
MFNAAVLFDYSVIQLPGALFVLSSESGFSFPHPIADPQ